MNSYMNWLQSSNIAVTSTCHKKNIWSNIIRHENEVETINRLLISIICLWGRGIGTYNEWCSYDLGHKIYCTLARQALFLHYVITAVIFEGRLLGMCRVFDNESWVLRSACKVTQHWVFDPGNFFWDIFGLPLVNFYIPECKMNGIKQLMDFV